MMVKYENDGQVWEWWWTPARWQQRRLCRWCSSSVTRRQNQWTQDYAVSRWCSSSWLRPVSLPHHGLRLQYKSISVCSISGCQLLYAARCMATDKNIEKWCKFTSNGLKMWAMSSDHAFWATLYTATRFSCYCSSLTFSPMLIVFSFSADSHRQKPSPNFCFRNDR